MSERINTSMRVYKVSISGKRYLCGGVGVYLCVCVCVCVCVSGFENAHGGECVVISRKSQSKVQKTLDEKESFLYPLFE